jgi:RNA polymerase sigma-70 factor, ECF subfamily
VAKNVAPPADEVVWDALDADPGRRGDRFARIVGGLRSELHAHCYRMLGSAHDADDALQEALIRAWRALDGFEGRGSVRSWLYTVATRTCLDLVDRRGRRALPVDLGPASDRAVAGDSPRTDIAWLGPYPDTLGSAPAGPGARYEQQEAVELAFVAAMQHLPGNQRAALLLFEVLGFSVAEIAAAMETSTASVNSALQRARATVADRIPEPSQLRTLRKLDDVRLRQVVSEFSSALERGDADALVALLTADVTWSMPPLMHWYRGLESTMDFAIRAPLTSCGQWRHLSLTANGQLACASYLRPCDDGPYEFWSINVLTLRDDRIAEITSFIGAEHPATFGLPAQLP